MTTLIEKPTNLEFNIKVQLEDLQTNCDTVSDIADLLEQELTELGNTVCSVKYTGIKGLELLCNESITEPIVTVPVTFLVDFTDEFRSENPDACTIYNIVSTVEDVFLSVHSEKINVLESTFTGFASAPVSNVDYSKFPARSIGNLIHILQTTYKPEQVYIGGVLSADEVISEITPHDTWYETDILSCIETHWDYLNTAQDVLDVLEDHYGEQED